MTTSRGTFPAKFPIGPDPLSEGKLKEILDTELTEWKIVRSPLPENPSVERTELFREYRFETFDNVIEYIGKVAVGCNIFPHHPRWENTWTTLKVWTTTWDIVHVISYKDIMLARFMDRTFEPYATSFDNEHSAKRIKMEKAGFAAQVRLLISKDDLESAFALINAYIALNPEKSVVHELTLVTARYNSAQKAKRLNEAPLEQIRIEMAQVRSACLDVLKQISAGE